LRPLGGLLSAGSVLARLVAVPLLLLGAGLMLAQPCAGGAFINTGSLTTARSGHTATLLLDGRVLVAGGSPGELASAELYDPTSGTWTPTGSLTKGRTLHTATLLPDGKVLVAGGFDGTFSMVSAELYDPASGTWTPTGNLATERESHTATLLSSGLVLIVGGIAAGSDYIVGIHASAELYDPVSGTWAATSSLAAARTDHTAILLPNGQELVAGGFNDISGYLTSAEIYDPQSGTWSDTGNLATERKNHAATLLPNGQGLVAGGEGTNGYLASAELYDLVSGTWTATGSLATARRDHTATLLPDGRALVIGGSDGTTFLASAELYDSASGAWTAAGNLFTTRWDHTATLLPNGKVLVAGGFNNSISHYLSSAELYDPTIVAIHVTNGDDDGPGSLRAAIRDADPSTRIDFAFTGVVSLTSSELLVDKDLTIVGPGPAMLTISRDPNSSATFRILEVSVNANVDLSGVTLSDGHPTDSPGGAILNNGVLTLEGVRITNNSPSSTGFPILTIVDAGGCDNSEGAEMTLTNCSVDGNACNGSGGGILNSGTLTVTNSTISGNTAGHGGGISSTGTLTMTNSTITGNTTITTGPHGFQGGYGGGLNVFGSTVLISDTISANQAQWSGGGIIGGSSVHMTNCILAANTVVAHPEEADISGTVQSGGYNLVGVSNDGNGFGPIDLIGDTVAPLDPKLGPLQNNGDLTSTMPLLPGSVALDHGISAGLVTDQTGAPRTVDQPNIANAPGGDGTDIGSAEAPITSRTFANISTRMSVGSSDNALIGGFIITGTQAKKVLVRAVGPSLPVSGALADPILELHDSASATIATNDNWRDSPDRQAIIDSALPPSDDLESAVIMTLEPAAYTAVVRGLNDTTGVGLIEIYDLDAMVDSKLANISTRGFVQTEDNVMIGGLIILGVNPTTTLVRAIGPSLPVSGALQDPTLELHNSDGATIAVNDNWRSDHEAEITATTLAPTNDAESAILATLVPSAYTAIVRGANGTTGVALVEVYDLE
jgi:Galactose oxidase, central domain